MGRQRKRATAQVECRPTRPTFKPLNDEQRRAKRLCDNTTICILTGPAGSAKTFCAIASAIDAVANDEADTILLTRPSVEACGESMGYLPGNGEDKLKPYMHPLQDAIEKYCQGTVVREKIRNATKIVPLAYMRGRTFSNAVCVMDEAQNATPEQIKMFLTRIGDGSRMILAGDTSQSDIERCTLQTIARRIVGIEGVGHHQFTESSIVRHPIIEKIIKHL